MHNKAIDIKGTAAVQNHTTAVPFMSGPQKILSLLIIQAILLVLPFAHADGFQPLQKSHRSVFQILLQ